MMLAGVKTLFLNQELSPRNAHRWSGWSGPERGRQTLSTWEERGEEKREESGQGHAGTVQGRLEKAGTRGPVRVLSSEPADTSVA